MQCLASRACIESSSLPFYLDNWDKAFWTRGIEKPTRITQRRLADYKERLGCYVWDAPEDLHADNFVPELAQMWLDRYPGNEPFFLQIGIPGPHPPYDPTQDYLDLYEGRNDLPEPIRDYDFDTQPGPILVNGPGSGGNADLGQQRRTRLGNGVHTGLYSKFRGRQIQIGLQGFVDHLGQSQMTFNIYPLFIEQISASQDSQAGKNVKGPGRGHVNGQFTAPGKGHFKAAGFFSKQNILNTDSSSAGKLLCHVCRHITGQQSHLYEPAI